jgi:hypothetical protein
VSCLFSRFLALVVPMADDFVHEKSDGNCKHNIANFK